MKTKKNKDFTDEELSEKIENAKKELNELMDEFHSRSSIRMEMAQLEFAEAKEKLQTVMKETESSNRQTRRRQDGLFNISHRPFYWSYRRFH